MKYVNSYGSISHNYKSDIDYIIFLHVLTWCAKVVDDDILYSCLKHTYS